MNTPSNMRCINSPMRYALEPIVAVGPGARSARICWWELLYRGRIPAGSALATPAEWRDWYAALPDVLAPIFHRYPAIRLSVNFSTYQLLDSRIRAQVVTLARWRKQLAVEWTEHPLDDPGLSGKREAARFLLELRRSRSVAIGIDDLGAGDDGVGRIVALGEPPDFVKFDGEVLRSAHDARRLRGLLQGQIRSYRRQRIAVVGEWVESNELRALGCRLGMNFLQGFLFPGIVGTTTVALQDVRLPLS